MALIPIDVRERISDYLGSQSKPYLIQFFDGDEEDFGCEYWDLPPQNEEDKPLHVRYQDIASKLANLIQNHKNDPEIEALKTKADELMVGVPVTKKNGIAMVSMKDLLLSGKSKGIRKEWWDLRSNFKDREACLFQGYRSDEARITEIADILIDMPGADQFEFLRMNSTRGNNDPIETVPLINALKKIDVEFGIVITSAREDSVEFIFEKPIESKDRARLRRKLHRLCPTAEELSESIKLGRVTLWWD